MRGYPPFARLTRMFMDTCPFFTGISGEESFISGPVSPLQGGGTPNLVLIRDPPSPPSAFFGRGYRGCSSRARTGKSGGKSRPGYHKKTGSPPIFMRKKEFAYSTGTNLVP